MYPSHSAGRIATGAFGLLATTTAESNLGHQGVAIPEAREMTLEEMTVRADSMQKSAEELNREIAVLRARIEEQQMKLAGQQQPEASNCKLSAEQRQELWQIRRQVDALLMASVETYDDDNCIG